MAIPVIFNGYRVVEPGVYSQIKSGAPAKSPIVTSGNLLILDTNLGDGFGSGSGILGQNTSGLNSVYGFDNPDDFRDFVKGGIFYDLADYIFSPTDSSTDRGPGMVYYLRAKKTTSASLSITISGKKLTMLTKNEGDFANGVISTEDLRFLTKGYAGFISDSETVAGTKTFEIHESSFAGKSPSGNYYNGLSEIESPNRVIVKIDSFTDMNDLFAQLKTNINFGKLFKFNGEVETVSPGNSDVDKLLVFAGATETYDVECMDKFLTIIKEIDFEFVLSDNYGENAQSIENTRILNFLKSGGFESDRFLIMGGADDELEFETQSIAVAAYYNSEKAILVHSGLIRYNIFSREDEELPSIYYAANIAGRLGGLLPQEPLTFKKTKANRFRHNLTEKQRILALSKGVIHNRNVMDLGQVVNQGINTLQRNTQLFNPDGTSYEISIMRIAAMLNKELVRKLRPLFIGNSVGKASPEDVKLAVQNYLRSRCVKDQEDNLIINFENVTVKFTEDYYDIKYGFYPNGPVNKMFLTGFMLDYNVSI